MIKKIIFLLFILSTNFVFSQNKDKFIVGKIYFKAHDIKDSLPDKAIAILEKLIDSTKLNPNQKYIGLAYNDLANLLDTRDHDINKYFDLNFKALKILEITKDSGNTCQIYENLGIHLAKLRRYDEAIKYHKIAFTYSKRNKISNVMVSSAMSIADCYSNTDRQDSALYLLKSLEANFPKDVTKTILAEFYDNIGNSYFNLGSTIQNKEYVKYAVKFAKMAKNLHLEISDGTEDIAFSNGLLAVSQMYLGDYEESKKNYLEAINLYEKTTVRFE